MIKYRISRHQKSKWQSIECSNDEQERVISKSFVVESNRYQSSLDLWFGCRYSACAFFNVWYVSEQNQALSFFLPFTAFIYSFAQLFTFVSVQSIECNFIPSTNYQIDFHSDIFDLFKCMCVRVREYQEKLHVFFFFFDDWAVKPNEFSAFAWIIRSLTIEFSQPHRYDNAIESWRRQLATSANDKRKRESKRLG